jgi:hypothetical protein
MIVKEVYAKQMLSTSARASSKQALLTALLESFSVVRKASRLPIQIRVVGADGNYHSAKNHLEAHGLGASTVISLPDRHHRELRTLAQRLRLHPVIERGSQLYRRLNRKR